MLNWFYDPHPYVLLVLLAWVAFDVLRVAREAVQASRRTEDAYCVTHQRKTRFD